MNLQLDRQKPRLRTGNTAQEETPLGFPGFAQVGPLILQRLDRLGECQLGVGSFWLDTRF